MTWYVQLLGDEIDLAMLRDSFTEPEAHIESRENGFILGSIRFDALTSAGAVRQEAIAIVETLNGGLFAILGAHEPLQVGGIIEEVADKQHVYVFPQPAVMRLRGLPPTVSIQNPDGTVITHRPADPLKEWLVQAALRPAVAKALRLRASPELGWVELYRILETVTTELSLEDIARNGWATVSELDNFKHTANSVAAVGDSARHGKEKTKPPRKPMSLSGARTLIDRIIAHWLGR